MTSESTATTVAPLHNFRISYNNFTNVLLAKLRKQFEDKRFCDATIICRNGTVYSHRCILAALCDRNLEDPVKINVNTETVNALVNFCYSGALDVDKNEIGAILLVAEELNCPYVPTSISKWVIDNLRKIVNEEDVLKQLSHTFVEKCIDEAKCNNEMWKDFLRKWRDSSENDNVDKQYSHLKKVLCKYKYIPLYKYAVVAGRAFHFDGESIENDEWIIPKNDIIVVLNVDTKYRVNVAQNGTITVYVNDKARMIHSLKAYGIYEAKIPILWLSNGSLVKLVNKTDPFEELDGDEKNFFQGKAWSNPPFSGICANVYLALNVGAVIHYPGSGSTFEGIKDASGFTSWEPLSCTDAHYAFANGQYFFLLCRDVTTYQLWTTANLNKPVTTLISGQSRQCPCIVRSLSEGSNVVIAIADLKTCPKTFYFVIYDLSLKVPSCKTISSSFTAVVDDEFAVM